MFQHFHQISTTMSRTNFFKNNAQRHFRRIENDFEEEVNEALAAENLPLFFPIIPLNQGIKASGSAEGVGTFSKMEVPTEESETFSEMMLARILKLRFWIKRILYENGWLIVDVVTEN